MTYRELVEYIRAGVQNGSWSASAAADAREFLTKNREEIRQQLAEYEQKKAEAEANGLTEHAQLLGAAMDRFVGHLIRQSSTTKDASIEVFEDSVKDAESVIKDLTFKTIEQVPGPVQVLVRQIGQTDSGGINDLLAESRFANADMFELGSGGSLSGASAGQYLVAKALLGKAGQEGMIQTFQSPGVSDADYKNYQAKFGENDPEFTSYSWAQNYVDNSEELQSQIDRTVESMLDPLGISKADTTQQELLRDVLEGTAVRGVQLEVAQRDKAAFQALVDKKSSGGKVSQSDIDAALRSAHSLSLTKLGLTGQTAEALVQREQSKLKDPTGGMTAEEATVARFGESVMDTLEYDRIALLDGVDSSGRPIDKYKSKKDVLDSTIGKAYLAQVDLRKKLADNPSFAEYARSRGLNVLPGQMPTPGQMRRFGRAIRRGTRRPVQPSGVMAELVVVDPDRSVTLGEGADARRVSFTVMGDDGKPRYLTKNELEEMGNAALGETEAYPIREIDLDNQNARDLLAAAVPGLATEMQIIDQGYRSSNDALAKRFEGSSVLVDVNTGKVVLIGQDRKVVKAVDAPEQIAQLRTYASNPEYAAIAADNARSREGSAGNALMAFDDRFKEGLRVDDVGIAIPEGVTLTAEVARKKIQGELGRRKPGQSMAEFNMIGRDEDGNPTYSVINVRDILDEPRALPPADDVRASRKERRARRKAGAPGKRGRAAYREEALPPLQRALQTAPAPAPAAPPAPVAEPAPAEEEKKEAAPPKSKSDLAERPEAPLAERTTPAPERAPAAKAAPAPSESSAKPRITPTTKEQQAPPGDVSDLIDDSTHDAVDAGRFGDFVGGASKIAANVNAADDLVSSLPGTTPRGEYARALGQISGLSEPPRATISTGKPRVVNFTAFTPTEVQTTASSPPDLGQALRAFGETAQQTFFGEDDEEKKKKKEEGEEEEEEEGDTGIPPTVARVPGAGMGLMTGAFSRE